MQPTCLEDWERWQQQGCTRLPALLVREQETVPESWEGFTDAPVSALLESAQTGRHTYPVRPTGATDPGADRGGGSVVGRWHDAARVARG